MKNDQRNRFTRSILFNLVKFFIRNNSQSVCHISDFRGDLILNQIEQHHEQRHAEEEVHRADGDADSRVNVLKILVRLGNKVSEPNRRQSDKAEVGRVQELPVFPASEKKGAAHDVTQHKASADNQGDLTKSAVRITTVEA